MTGRFEHFGARPGGSYPRRTISRRPAIPRPLMVSVFRRDCWTCRYSGRPTVFYPVMPLLGRIFPEQFPYHSNWNGGHTHPAVTACTRWSTTRYPALLAGRGWTRAIWSPRGWPCNARKGDLTLEQLGWQHRDVDDSPWDGLSDVYRALWEIAGKPTEQAHPRWLQPVN